MDGHSENFNKEMENVERKCNKEVTGLNNKIIELKKYSRLVEAEESISQAEDQVVELTQSEQQIEKRMKKREGSLRSMWDNIKQTNIHSVRSQKENREKGGEVKFEEILSENLPNLEKETDIWIYEAQRISNKMSPKGPT